MLTPLPRIRPWDLAGRVATLDHLSGGRVQLAVGLGALHDGWLAFEADEGRKVRAEKLDEGLAVYDGLMQGQPFSFSGKHYQARPTDFPPPPPPVQQPRVPVWVVGAYPPRSRCGGPLGGTGCCPRRSASGWTLPSRRPIWPRWPAPSADSAKSWACRGRATTSSPKGFRWPATADAQVAEWVAAGATWWVESDWTGGPTPWPGTSPGSRPGRRPRDPEP